MKTERILGYLHGPFGTDTQSANEPARLACNSQRVEKTCKSFCGMGGGGLPQIGEYLLKGTEDKDCAMLGCIFGSAGLWKLRSHGLKSGSNLDAARTFCPCCGGIPTLSIWKGHHYGPILGTLSIRDRIQTGQQGTIPRTTYNLVSATFILISSAKPLNSRGPNT